MVEPSLFPLQAVVTGVWAAATVFFSSFGYTTMRTGAHMADTGTEHNIDLIVGVSTLQCTSQHETQHKCQHQNNHMLTGW